MAQLAFMAGGAALGAATLGTGAVALGLTGTQIGAFGGSLLFNALFAPKPADQRGPNFGDATITTSAYGRMVPLIWGTMPVGGNIIDASPVDTKKKKSGGGKGGPSTPKTTTFTHFADIHVLVCEATPNSSYKLLQIYCNERLILDETAESSIRSPDWLDFDFYVGSETQEEDATFVALRGADEIPAYRGWVTCAFKRFKLDEFGLSDQIALQFRFLVARTGTAAASETIIDTTTLNSLSTDVPSIAWSQYSDTIFFGLQMSSLPVGSSRNILQALNPYTKSVIWERRLANAGLGEDQIARDFILGSIPRFLLGVQINVPDEQVCFVHYSTTGGNAWLEIVDADTGATRVHAKLNETDPPHWIQIANALSVDIWYNKNVGIGSGQLRRLIWTGTDSSDLIETLPYSLQSFTFSGTWAPDPDVIPGSDGEGTLCLAMSDASNEGVLVFNETVIAALGTTIDLGGFSITTLSDLNLINKIIYDPTQEAFWLIGQHTSSTKSILKKINKNGSVLDTWDMDTDLGITGYVALTGDLNWSIDPVRGRLVFGWNGNYYLINTADPELDLEVISWPSSTLGEGVYHPPTGNFYTKQSEDLHIVRLRTVTAGTEDLETVVDNIMLYDGPSWTPVGKSTKLMSSDIDNSALSGITVEGFAIARSNMSRRAALQTLMDTYLFDVVPRNGVLTSVLRGAGSSAGTLTEDHIGAFLVNGSTDIASNAPEPIEISRIDPEQLPRRLELHFIDREHNWEQGVQPALRLASNSGIGTEEEVQLAVSLTNNEAAQLANILCHMRHIEAERYDIVAMPSQQSILEPGNIVSIDFEGETYSARVDRADIIDGGLVDAHLVRADASVYTDFSVGGEVRNPDRDIYSTGSSILLPLDIGPIDPPNDFDAGYYVSAYTYTPNSPGVEIFKSVDGSSYAAVGQLAEAASVGIILEIVSNPVALKYLTQEPITLSMVSGDALQSESLSDFESDATLNSFAVGAAGRWVIGRFVTETQNADDTYTLDGVILGLAGTEQYVSQISANDRFVILDTDTLARVALPTTDLNVTNYVRAVTLGRQIDSAPDNLVVPAGTALKPFAPHGLNATGFGGDLTLTCQERERQPGATFWPAPAVETGDSYTWDILDFEDTVVRTLTSNDPTITYSSANQTADFGSTITFVRFRVARVSADVGTSFYSYGRFGSKVSWENTILSYTPDIFIRFEDADGSSTVVDSSGNGFDGAVSAPSEPDLEIEGAYDNGIYMQPDGSGSAPTINFGNDSQLTGIVSSDFTLGIWLRTDETPISGEFSGNLFWQTVGLRLTMSVLSDQVRFTFIVDGSTDARARTNYFDWDIDTWKFICCTFTSSSGQPKMYIDGVEITYETQQNAVSVSSTTSNLTIGASSYDKMFDEAFIVPSVLTGNQILALYNKRTE